MLEVIFLLNADVKYALEKGCEVFSSQVSKPKRYSSKHCAENTCEQLSQEKGRNGIVGVVPPENDRHSSEQKEIEKEGIPHPHKPFIPAHRVVTPTQRTSQ